MITVIRRQLIENKAYKGMVWVMLVLMIVSLGLPSLVSQSSKKNSWVALVNDTPIEYDEYSRKVADYEYRIRMFKRQFGDSFMSNFNPQMLALDGLIRNELIGQAARMVPFAINEEVLHDTLSDADFVYTELSDMVPAEAFDPSTGIKDEQLNHHLRALGVTHSEFQHKVVNSIQRFAMKDLVSLASYTPQTQLKEQYINDYAGKKFSVATVSYDDCLQQVKKKGVTPQELQAFFDKENSISGRYYVAEKRTGIVATCYARDYDIVVTDDQIESYYNEHKTEKFVDKPTQIQVRHLVVNTAEQAQQLRDELVGNPSLFEKKVAEHSLDTTTAQSGGLLPAFTRASTQDPLREKAAFLLKHDGDISEVIATDNRFEILQRVKRIPATFISLAQARKDIRTQLINTAFAAAFNHDMELLTRTTETEKRALDRYVAAHHGSTVEHSLKSNDGSTLMANLFNLKQGQSTYYIEGDTATIVMLTRIEPRHASSLSTVRDTVEQDYYKEQARSLVHEIMEKAQKDAVTSPLSEVSTRYNLSLTTTPFIKKSDEKLLTSWRAKNFPVDFMLQVEKEGIVKAHEHEGNGYVVRLDEISPLDGQDFKAHTKDLIARLERENRQMVGAGFVASLYRHATIKQNELLATT